MSHPFGDRLSQHLHRKHGLSQSKLAAGILQAPAIITDMCKGRRLTGPQARERVLAMIQWLHQQAALATVDEANALLAAADMVSLRSQVADEATLLQQLQSAPAQKTTAPMAAPVDLPPVTPRHNLPAQSTTFIGRTAEQTQLAALLADSHCRLLTLVGPGGVGKTRLALQVVTPQVEHYAQGVWFVALAPLVTADLVAATCLEALNLGQQPHLTPDEQLLHYLRHKQMLLVLDNVEHLPVAVGLVKAILSTAPQVKVLVTSRERLKVQEEWVFTVNGLETTTVAAPLDAAQAAVVAESSASRLFVERARRLQPAFTLTADNVAAIDQLCRMVDGIPLAIELAAGWSRLLPPAAIAQAIAQDIGFLSSAWQDLPERHQSLTAVFAHSWRLLTAAEQTVLCQLVVFRGGFAAAAAQAVAGAALRLLGELVDKSWLRVNAQGRFDLHELIRQFIVYQNGEPATELLARHSRYYGAFLQSQEPFLYGPHQRDVLTTLLAEVDNIRQGWRWAVEQVAVESIGQYLKSWQWLGEVRSWNQDMARLFGEAAGQLKSRLPETNVDVSNTALDQVRLILARTLYCQARHVYGLELPVKVEVLCHECLAYWPEGVWVNPHNSERNQVKLLLSDVLYEQGRYTESEALCSIAQQECVHNHDQIGLYAAFRTLGFNAYAQGRFTKAQQYFEQSFAIANQIGGQVQTFSVLSMLAEIVANQGDYERAERYTWEVIRLAESLGSVRFVICGYTILGYSVFLKGQTQQAKQYFEKCLTLSKEINADFLYLNSQRWLGNIAYRQQDYTTAHQCFYEALMIATSLHRETDVAIALAGLGRVACAQKNFASAHTSFHQALAILQKTGAQPDLLDTLVGVSQLRLQEDAPTVAAQLIGFVQQQPALLPLGRQGAAQVYQQLQRVLPPEILQAAQSSGEAMAVEEAVALALAGLITE